MARWTLCKTLEIDAAHHLPGHGGKCANPHGHRWQITIKIETFQLDENGMVIDFGKLSELVRVFDHKDLNEFSWPMEGDPPTAENIARCIASGVVEELGFQAKVSVTVAETPGAEVTCEL